MKRVLVTGAAGFIGSHVAEALLDRGDEVVGLDEVNDYYPVTYKRENLALLGRYPRFSFVEGDICDRRLVEKLFATRRFSHLAHLAARAGVRPSITHPFVYQRTICEGTLTLLSASVGAGLENVVIASSSSVYGNSRVIPFREDDSVTDRPISPYAATKKAAEVMAHTFHHVHGLPITIIRPFTVFGPRGRPDMAPWLFVESALRGRPIRKFGDGTTERDYVFIDDFVRGFVTAIDRPLGYEIVNLGSSVAVSLNEALDVVMKVTGRQLEIEHTPPQLGDVESTIADITKARQLLDYDATTSFRDGMARFCDWFRRTRL